MIKQPNEQMIGLVIQTGAYGQRSPRAQLDLALAAAALEQTLRLYFLGNSVLQLLNRRQLEAAHLPAGYRAWASLPELTQVAAFAEPPWLDWLQRGAFELSLPMVPASRSQMQADWSTCSRLMVL